MKTRTWIGIGVVLTLIGGALAWAAYGYGTRTCALLKAANLLREPKDRVPIDCIEFWINRYQSAWAAVFATVGTLSAAGIAWIAVQRQIVQARFATLLSQWQTAIAARAAMFRDRQLISDAVSYIKPVAADHIVRTVTANQAQVLIHYERVNEKADALLFEANASGSPWSERTTEIRGRLLLTLRVIQSNCYEIRAELYGQAAAALQLGAAASPPALSPAHQRLAQETSTLLQSLDNEKAEFLQSNTREIAPLNSLCEQLRREVFAHKPHSAASNP